ncbi:hypothetical protein BZA77DRAFT_348392 [Pyronema omphalodes]|nr:hypothetical protein BZA77DRAFT_348392 [Pyronema omphalodes]
MFNPTLPTVTLSDLLQHTDTKTRQTFANEVKYLDISSSDCKNHHHFLSTKFPKLLHISIDGSDDNSSPDLYQQYLSPTLKIWQFYGGYLSDEFLLQLASSCPELEEVLIDNPRNTLTAAGFLSFLQSPDLKNLKRLIILYDMETILSPEVFMNLSLRSGLEVLGIRHDEFPLLISHERRPLFQDLKELDISAPLECLIEYSKNGHFPTLSRLEILLKDASEDFTASFGKRRVVDNTYPGKHVPLTKLASAFPGLEVLCIDFSERVVTDLQPADLVGLVDRLGNLRELRLEGMDGALRGRGIGDSEIEALAKMARKLEVLRLRMTEMGVTDRGLRAVATVCGNIRELELGGRFGLRLQLPGQKGVRFPALKELELGEVVFTGRGAEDLVRGLMEAAPELKDFRIEEGESEFVSELRKIWRARQEMESEGKDEEGEGEEDEDEEGEDDEREDKSE